jgi:hypothetical protein
LRKLGERILAADNGIRSVVIVDESGSVDLAVRAGTPPPKEMIAARSRVMDGILRETEKYIQGGKSIYLMVKYEKANLIAFRAERSIVMLVTESMFTSDKISRIQHLIFTGK